MPKLKTYSKVTRTVVDYSTIFSDPVATTKRNLSDDSIASSINKADSTDSQAPLSSTMKNGTSEKLVFKPYDSNVTAETNQTLKSKDGSRISTRGRKKPAVKSTVKLFTSTDEDSTTSSNAKSQTDTLTENNENSVPVERRSSRVRLTKTQSASEIGAAAPKLKSIMKKPAVKKVELKSKLKKKADLLVQEVSPATVPAVEEPETVKKGGAKSDQVEETGDNKTKKPTAASKKAPRIMEIINDKNDQLTKDVVCDNKTKYTTTTSTPQFRRRKLKLKQDLSIICKTDSPASK